MQSGSSSSAQRAVRRQITHIGEREGSSWGGGGGGGGGGGQLPDCSLLPQLHLLSVVLLGFSCCSPIACIDPLQLLLRICVHFNCCSPIAFASAPAPWLQPLQLLLPNCICFSGCIHFRCCTPIVSTLQIVSIAFFCSHSFEVQRW